MIGAQEELLPYVHIMRKYQAKITPQRIEILKILLNNKNEHFTAEDILRKLGGTGTGQATVYRTLELFCNAGILKKVYFQNEEITRYDLVDLNHRHFHHHLVCDRCGKVIEVKDDLLEELENKIEKLYDFTVMNHELTFSGLCGKCRKGEKDD